MNPKLIKSLLALVLLIAGILGISYSPKLTTIVTFIDKNFVWFVFLGGLFAVFQRRLYRKYPNKIRNYTGNCRVEGKIMCIFLDTKEHKNLKDFWSDWLERWLVRIQFWFMSRRDGYERTTNGCEPVPFNEKSAFVGQLYDPMADFVQEKGDKADLILDDDNLDLDRDLLLTIVLPSLGPAGKFCRMIKMTLGAWRRMADWDGLICLDQTAVLALGVKLADFHPTEANIRLAIRIREAAKQVVDEVNTRQPAENPICLVLPHSRLLENKAA